MRDTKAETLAAGLLAVVPEAVGLFNFGPQCARSGLCDEK